MIDVIRHSVWCQIRQKWSNFGIGFVADWSEDVGGVWACFRLGPFMLDLGIGSKPAGLR